MRFIGVVCVYVSIWVLVNGCMFMSGETYLPLFNDRVVFWDRQTAESANFIRGKTQEFNELHPGIPIYVERAGGYTEIFRKVSASIQARKLPALSVSYESMTSEYIPTGAVVCLDDYVYHSELGLSREDLGDFFPAVLESNRYVDFGNKFYSFPLAKSVLVMYFNQDVLDTMGISSPARTWQEFLDHLRELKRKTGKKGYAISIDCSTVVAMIYSFGGELVHGRTTLFDTRESIEVFTFLQNLIRENLAYVITPGTFEDQVALAKGEIVYMIRSSSLRISLELLEKERKFRWGIAPLPHKEGSPPVTVLFGPNVTIFKVGEEQQKRAWLFVRFMTSRDVVVQWAIETGYIPIRKSSAEHPLLLQFWNVHPYARVPYDCLMFAKPEPNLSGWQQVRDLVESAELEVLTLMNTPENVCRKLKSQADSVLSLQY